MTHPEVCLCTECAEAAKELLTRVAELHAPNKVTKCCEQCGRPSPCLTLEMLTA